MRTIRYALGLAVMVPALAGAQVQTPTMPIRTLAMELLKAKPGSIVGNGVGYERAGLKPKEFRVGSSPQMTGANWQTFTEGPTTTKTVNGRTVHVGNISGVGTLGAGCGNQSVWYKAWLQFRTTDITGKATITAVKGDSTCAGLPG